MTFFERIKSWARRIKRDSVTLWFAYRDPRTPWYAKALCVFVVAYALSPIDLIPDFIPVLGYVDDALLLPALIWVALRIIPQDVIADCRSRGDDWISRGAAKPRSVVGAIFIVLLWVALGLWLWVAVIAPRLGF